jgi:hypothetical protein
MAAYIADRLEAAVAAAAAVFRDVVPARDWIDELVCVNDDALKGDGAVFVAGAAMPELAR